MQAVVHGVYPCQFTSSWEYTSLLNLGIRNNAVHCLESCFVAPFLRLFTISNSFTILNNYCSRTDDKQKPALTE